MDDAVEGAERHAGDHAANARRGALFNDSLSCGSRLVSALRAPHGFTLAVFKLTQRPGADCGSGTGHTARTAIRVRNGKIAGWYRLPDDPGDAAPVQPADPPEPSAIV